MKTAKVLNLREDDEADNSVADNTPMTDSEIVTELETLLLAGDHEQVVEFIHPIIGKDVIGFKRAKQLLREARDRGKARITRVHGVAQVILSEFEPKEEE